MRKLEMSKAVLYTMHESQKIKTQAKQAFDLYHKVEAADPALKAGFVVDDNDRVYLCVEQSGSDFVVILFDNWERCFKCQVLPGASKVGVSITYPKATIRTKTLSPAKIRKEIERAILINERYKAAQAVKVTAIMLMKGRILAEGGNVVQSDTDFHGEIFKNGLTFKVYHVLNDEFKTGIFPTAPPTLDNFLMLADNKYQAE